MLKFNKKLKNKPQTKKIRKRNHTFELIDD